MEEGTETGDELEAECAEVGKVKASENLCRLGDMEDFVSSGVSVRLGPLLDLEINPDNWSPKFVHIVHTGRPLIVYPEFAVIPYTSRLLRVCPECMLSDQGMSLIGGRRVVDAIVVSAVILLAFVYLYLIGYIDRGGSTGGSSSSLDFRDIYISILLFQAAYVWIKFRDVIPRGAVYHRRDSNKYEPRIKFPVTRGVGGTSKRIALGSYDTFAEGAVAYKIAAFYCNRPGHRVGRLDLGGGAYFTIPTLNVDPNLPYKEKVKQVGDQVLRVYEEFKDQKTSRNLPPSIPELISEMQTGEGQLLSTPPIQQLQQPLNAQMDSAMQAQGSELGPNNIHNGVDFNNPGSAVLAKTQHELLEAYKENGYLKAQLSQMEVENMGWELKHSELERKNLELEQKISELERKNGLLNHQIMESQLQPLHPEQGFDTDVFLTEGHEVSLVG